MFLGIAQTCTGQSAGGGGRLFWNWWLGEGQGLFYTGKLGKGKDFSPGTNWRTETFFYKDILGIVLRILLLEEKIGGGADNFS